MADNKSGGWEAFVNELRRLVDQGVEFVGSERVSRLLWQMLVELDPSQCRFDVHYEQRQGVPTLVLSYTNSIALRLDLDQFTGVQGLMVDIDEPPPLMERLEMVVTGDQVDKEVRLEGRAVHYDGEKVALEVVGSGDAEREELVGLIEAMESGAGSSPSIESEANDDEQGAEPVVYRLIEQRGETLDVWEFAQKEVADLLRSAADIDGYCLLELSGGDDGIIQYVLYCGRLIDVRSCRPGGDREALVDRLVSMEHIDEQDRERARELASIYQIPIQDALVDMGAISLEELHAAIKTRLVEQLDQLWDLDAQRAELYELDTRPELRHRRSALDVQRHVERRLREGVSRGPEAIFTPSDPPRLMLNYPSGARLRRALGDLLEKRGLSVKVDPAPPLMDELEISVTVDGTSEEVALKGRAVHQGHEGMAFQIFPVKAQRRKQLEKLAVVTDEAIDATPAAASPREPIRSEQPAKKPQEQTGVPAVDRLVDRPRQAERVWKLDEIDVDDIIEELAELEDYSVLELQQPGDVTVQYLLHFGRLIDVRRDPLDDNQQLLLDKLVERGTVTDEEVERAEVLASIHEIPVQDALVDMGCMTLENLLEAIEARLVEDLEQLWEIEADQARLYLLDSRPPLRLRRAAVELKDYVESFEESPEHREIMLLHAQIQGADHFEVLGVHWSAYGEEIADAYQQIQRQLDVPAMVQRQLHDEIAEIRRAVSKAYATLKNAESRQQYRRSQVDSFSLDSTLRMYKEQVDTLTMREDKSEAVDTLKRVVELEPSNRKMRRQLEAIQHIQQS